MRQPYFALRREVPRVFGSPIGKTALIYPAAFLVSTGMYIFSLGLNFYLKDVFNASGRQIGAIFALFALCYTVSCLGVRPLTDSVRPQFLLLAATALMFIFSLSIVLCHSMRMIFLFYSLFACGTSIFWPPIMGWVSEESEGVQLGKVMSKFNLSWSTGAIIGSPLAGALSQVNPNVPLW